MTLPNHVRTVFNCLEGVVYATDTNGIIQAIGEPTWSDFANENNGETIARPGDAQGKNIFDFISGEDVRQSYRDHLSSLKDDPARARIAFPFRCDAPDKRREMRMAISPLMIDGELCGFIFQSIVWAEVQRPAMALYDFAGLLARLASERDLPVLDMCSYCQKVRLSPGEDRGLSEWVEASEYYRRGGDENVTISHGICLSCKEAVWNRGKV